MKYKGKAIAPLTGHVAVIQHRQRLRKRREAEMYREISLEVPICESFRRPLIEEKSEKLYEIRFLLGHERNHALDIARAVEIIVV